MNFESLFVNPRGRISRGQFLPGLITLLAVVAFYALVVKGNTAQWCLIVLLYPAIVLHARRLHDMGYSAWLLLAPAILLVLAFCVRMRLASLGASLDAVVPPVALVVGLGFALWGSLGKGQADANRFGAPAAA